MYQSASEITYIVSCGAVNSTHSTYVLHEHITVCWLCRKTKLRHTTRKLQRSCRTRNSRADSRSHRETRCPNSHSISGQCRLQTIIKHTATKNRCLSMILRVSRVPTIQPTLVYKRWSNTCLCHIRFTNLWSLTI